ncbi:serine/threonine-protein phosphatase CPPED1 isoform X1 [Danio rerio]|uniref:Serine/threonine-protein phosphatase CPPED1 isoform X1 n=1 Tax=Danio rerio TaxID=7955 RepID=A0AC58GVE5_DANRE
MAADESVFLRAKDRSYKGLTEDEQKEWSGPFYFIQAADPQLGLMKAWRIGDCDSGGDEWDEEVQLTKQAVQAINKLQPKPRFIVLCGDLVHAMPGSPFREQQIKDLKDALRGTDPDIPLVFVSGNHDLGNAPTPDTVEQFCHEWGDDYFSFWHIPLFLRTPDEEDDYFNLQRGIRELLIQRFKRAGVKAVFSGHYHRNAGGCHDGLDMVVSSAVGCQLGDDTHGVRVVVVTENNIIHRYHSLDQLSERGMDEDLKKLLL